MKALVACAAWRREYEPMPVSDDDVASVSAGAELGIPACQLLLGRWHQFGHGVTQNYEIASTLFQSAAQKTPEGLVALGQLAELGHGRAVSYPDAIDLYKKASVSAEPAAFVALGRIHEAGLGVPRDPRVAADFYRKAALRFSADAWTRLYQLQADQQVLTPEELAADKRTWLRELMSRTLGRIQDSGPLQRLGKAATATLAFSFSRGATKPQITFDESSGDAQFDKVLLSTLVTLRMPPPPFDKKTEENYVVKLPIKYALEAESGTTSK